MIKFSNDWSSEFFVSSGAWGFDGRDSGHGIIKLWKSLFRLCGCFDLSRHVPTGTSLGVITKSLTFRPRPGNLRLFSPWRCVRLLGGGNVVNCVGLTNPGYQWFVSKCWPRLYKNLTAGPTDSAAIVSLWVDDSREAALMARDVSRGCVGLSAIQVNISCPNVHNERDISSDADAAQTEFAVTVIDAMRAETGLPLILKLGIRDPYVQICREVKDKVEAVELINAVPWSDCYGRESPLECYGIGPGGVSGPIIRSSSKRALTDVRVSKLKVPVISGGGISGGLDDCLRELLERKSLGADAFALGTIFLTRPWLPRKLLKYWKKATGYRAV